MAGSVRRWGGVRPAAGGRYWPAAVDLDRVGAVAAVLALAVWTSVVLLDAPDEGAGKSGAGSGGAGSAGITLGVPETLYGAYGGAPYTHPSDIRFRNGGATDLIVHDVNWDGKPFKSPIYYGVRAIRWSGTGPGAMLDFTHSKTISQREQDVRFSGTRNGRPAPGPQTVGDAFRHLEFSHGHNMLTFNGMARLFQITPRLQPYVGGGLGIALPHTEIQFYDEAKRTYEYQYAGPVGQVLAGLEVRLPRVSLFFEYKFSLARYEVPLSGRDSRGWGFGDFPNQFLAWFGGRSPENGTATTTLASHQLIGGVAVRVGGPALVSP